jgi:hypothetical protein
MTRKLTLHLHPSVVGDFWVLRRVEDGRTEASGFATRTEALSWTADNGWEIQE